MSFKLLQFFISTTTSTNKNKPVIIKTFLIFILCFTFLKCLSNSNDGNNTKSGSSIAAYLSFERDSPLNDISGNGNDGKVIGKGKAVFKTGKQGLCFDASQGTLSISTKSLGDGSSGTIDMLVNFSSFEGQQIICTFYSPSGNPMILSNKDHVFMFRYYKRSVKKWFRYSFPKTKTLMNTNQWHHLSFTWEYNSKGTDFALLIDSELAGCSEIQPKLELGNDTLFIGGQHNGTLNGQCLIDEFRLSNDALPIIKKVSSPLEIASEPRKRIADRTYFFSRSQPQYNLYMNYIYNHHIYKYNDRPLFYNRDLWNGDENQNQSFLKSVSRNIQNLQLYGLDGLAFITHDSALAQKSRRELADAFAKLFPKNVKVMLEFTGEVFNKFDDYKEKSVLITFLDQAMQNPAAFRLNGKIVATSYHLDTAPPVLKKALDFAHKIHEDKFIFIAAIGLKGVKCKNWRDFMKEFNSNNGAVPAVEIDALKQHLRSYLDVCDGIMYTSSNHTDTDHHFDERFYRDFLVPCFTSVLTEPKYRNKYLALSASVGYVNQFSGVVSSHDGTRQLRQSIEAALSANPDIINMPEWNEFNENTCLQPTVLSSMASQRILKYYTSKNKGLLPQPNPGDNPLMPDLIVSMPVAVKLGDRMFIELLNVPDSTVKEKYEVSVSLVNSKGDLVKKFPVQTLDAELLQEKRLYFSTENAGDSPVLCPQVTIKTASGRKFSFDEGLYPVLLRPTCNWNYNSVRQPLQDLAHVAKCEFTVSEKAGKTIFKGAVKCDESIATLELLEDEIPIFAVDPNEEFKLKKDEALVFINWNCRINPNAKNAEVAIEVENGEIRHMLNMHRGIGVSFDEPLIRTGKSSARLPYYRQNFWRRRGGFFIVTNKDEAIIKTTVVSLPDCSFSIPVKQIVEAGVYTKKIAPSKLFMIRFESTDKLLDIPMLNESEANFTTEIMPLNKNSVFHLQVVTSSGKIYRSHPLVLPQAVSGDVELPVLSDSQHKVITVKKSLEFIPDIKYVFTDRHGNTLVNTYGYSWNAELGGGFAYKGPYNRKAPVVSSGPKWVKHDGELCIKFNNDYINFPHCVFPLRSGFTVIFDIYPESENKQCLLNVLQGYRLMIKQGQLVLEIIGEDGYSEQQTGLKLPVNKWSRVTLTYYPGKGFHVKVNDKLSPLLPFTGRCLGLYNEAVFGALGKTCFFKGLLKSLRVLHKPTMQ